MLQRESQSIDKSHPAQKSQNQQSVTSWRFVNIKNFPRIEILLLPAVVHVTTIKWWISGWKGRCKSRSRATWKQSPWQRIGIEAERASLCNLCLVISASICKRFPMSPRTFVLKFWDPQIQPHHLHISRKRQLIERGQLLGEEHWWWTSYSRNLLPHKIATTERVTWTNKKPINICKISAKFISGKVLEPNVFARAIRHPETIFQR